MKTQKPMANYVLTIFFASLLCAGSFVIIPLPLGISLAIQDMLALLNGILLGAVYGGLSVLIFLLIGTIGLPVFTGKGGFQIIFNGPTGGILVGYFFGAIVSGFITKILINKKNTNNFYEYISFTLSTLLGFIIIFIFGIFGFVHNTGVDFQKAIYVILIPFIPITIIKIILIVLISKKYYKIVKNYLY